MPNEFDAALSHFTPDPKALAEARKKRLKKADSYEQGYREGQQIREEQERAAKQQLQEQERLDQERAKAEAQQADLARKQRLADTERAYAREGRPTRTDAMGEIFTVDDDETWQRKQAEKKVAEELKAQSRADAAFRKAEAVRLNQAETKLKAGLDDFDTAEAIGSQAVSAKASQIISLSQARKAASDDTLPPAQRTQITSTPDYQQWLAGQPPESKDNPFAIGDYLATRIQTARKEKELLENSERTIKVAKLNKEQELKPALGAIQQKRDVLPITTAPAIPKGAGVTLQNTVSTATPTPASADPERAAAVLRTQITVLREKGDFARADALERRLVNPAKWEAEQKAFRQTATPEQLAQTVNAGRADITEQWQATEQVHSVLSAQRQAYYDRLDRAKAKNDALLNQPYSDGDVAVIRDETTGEETRWHKAAAVEYNSALQGLNGWQQANQEKIDLLNLNQQQLQIEAANLDKHVNQLNYLGREQQRQKDGEQATVLNQWRATPGMAEFADETERRSAEFKQRQTELERKYPDPKVRQIAAQALQEDFAKSEESMQERMAAKEKGINSLYADYGSTTDIDDWQTTERSPINLKKLAEDRGITEQEARTLLDTGRKSDWRRPLPGDEKGVRKLPSGQLSVDPKLWLDPKDYEKAVNDSDATPEAKKAAISVRRDLAAPDAAAMLLDLQKVPEFAEYLAKTTSGSPVERMEQFQADLKAGGTLAASIQRMQGGTSSLASSALGAVAAVTGSDYFRGKAEEYQQRAQAFETAGTAGARGTNAVGNFTSKIAGAAPSLLGAMVPGGLALRGAQAVNAFRLASTAARAAQMRQVVAGFKGAAGAYYGTAVADNLLAASHAAMMAAPALNRVALAGAALGSGAQSFGGTYLDAIQAFEKQGLSPTEAHGRAVGAALLSGSVTTALTALSGLRGAESLLAQKEIVKKTLVDRAKEIGIGFTDEALEEGVDQLAQGIIALHTYNPSKKIGDILSESLEAALIGGVLGGGMTALSETADHFASKDTLLAEDLAAADAEITNYQDETADQTENDHRRNRAALAKAIAQGVGLDGIEEVILNSAGWTRKDKDGVTRADGSLTKIKDYQGPNVLDVDNAGKVKLDKTYVSKLGEVMPVTAGLVGSKQTTWHKPGQIEEAKAPERSESFEASAKKEPISPAPAKPAPSAKPSSGEVGPRTPAGTSQTRGTSAQGAAPVTDLGTGGKTEAAAPAVSGAAAVPPATGTPVTPVNQVKPDSKEAVSALLPTYTAGDPRPQRAWEIANHLEMAGLDRPTANIVAANAIRFQGIVGKTVNEQVTSKEFNTFLDEQGATGDRSTREGTEPLKISQPTASQETAKPAPAPALQTSKPPVKKPEPQSPVRPEYATLRDRLKSKDISTVDAVREVIRLSGETDTGVLQDLLTDHLGLKKPSAAAAVETLRAAGELKGDRNDDISIASSPRNPSLTAQNAWQMMLSPSAKQGIATDYIDGLKVSLANANTLANDRAVSPAVRQKARQDADQLRTLIPQEEEAWQRIRQQHTSQQLKQIYDDATAYSVPVSELQADLDGLLADFPDAATRPAWANAQIEHLRSEIKTSAALPSSKRASDRQSKPSDKAYTAAKEFVPATQGALAENPAWARAKLLMLARTPPARRRWAYRFLTQLENTISQRAGLYDAFAVGQTARQALEGNKIAVVPIQGKTTLAIDLDRMLADFSYLGDPRAAAVATVMEEDIHAAQFRLMAKGGKWTKGSLAQQWRDLPAPVQKTVWQAYHAANPGKAMPNTWSDNAAFQMQSEFLRMLVQGRIDPKSITEAVDASPGLIQSIKDLLADLYDTLRSLIKGLPVSQAVTLDQQVTELKAALEQLGKPSTAEELRTKLFLRDPSAVAMQALKNGTVFDQLATQDALFTPQGLRRVWDLLTPEMRAQVLRLKKTAAPWLSKKRSDNAALTRDLLTFLLDPRAAQALAQANLTGSPAATASTGMVRRALRAMSDYFRSPRPDFAQTLSSLDLPTAQVLQQMQSLLVNARAQFEASAAVQKLPTLVIAEPQAGDEEDTDGPAARSARAMIEAWMQEAQQRAFFDQAAQMAEEVLPGVSDALQRRAIARQMAGQTWDALKSRMEAVAAGSPSPSLPVSQSRPLALPSPAQRSAAAIEEALTDRDNLAQQNTSPAARDAIARRLMQEEWSAAILSTVANAERRYYLNQQELTPVQIRQIESLLQVASGDLTLGWQADRRQIGQSPDSGAPVRQMGLSRENALAVLGIRIGSDGTAYAAATAPVYIEGGTILIKQSTLDDLSQTLPITRRQFRLSEDEQRARIGLRGAPQPVTAATVAEARAADQQQQDTSKSIARLEQLEAQDRAAEKTSEKPAPLIDPNADPNTGKLHRGERGDLISWLGDHGSLGWPDTQAGGEWDWFLDLLGDYYNPEVSASRTRKKALRDSSGNVIGFKDAAVQGTKLGMTNTAKKMAREGNLTTPAAIVEYLIQEGVVSPAIPTEDGSPRNLSLHENIGDRTGIDAIEEAAREANHDLPDGIGNAVLTALDGREAARTNRQNDPERAAELQTLRFERDTRSGPVVIPAHELAPLSDDGPTFITARSQDGDMIPLEVASYEWQPIDPESAEADDYLEGHPAWRGAEEGNPERLVITLRGGTYYGQQTIPGDTLLRVEDAGNTGIGVDLGDGKGDFVTDEEPETPVETTETEGEPEPEIDGKAMIMTMKPGDRIMDSTGVISPPLAKLEIVRTRADGTPTYGITFDNEGTLDGPYRLSDYSGALEDGGRILRANEQPGTTNQEPETSVSTNPALEADNEPDLDSALADLEAALMEEGDTPALFASLRTTPEQRRDELTSTEVDVQGTRVRTGSPVTFRFLHNKQSATKIWGKPKKDSDFDRGFEPSGRYVSEVTDPDYLLKNFPNQYEAGELTFENPIVIDGGTYGEPTSWKRRLSTLYGGTRGKRLSQAIIADGYDGVITVSDRGNPSEILDLTTFDARKALYAAPRLQALHNLSAENLIFADKMGGIAVPSMAVTPEGQGMSGFGNITLIGTRDLVDPAKEPVFDADAYSPRFPDPEFPKAKSKDAQKVVDDIRPFAKAFGDNSLTDSIWDNAVNRPRPGDTVEKMQRSDAAKAAFLASQGIQVQPVMKATGINYEVVREPAFQSFRDDPQQWFQTDYNDSAAMQRLGTLVKDAELKKIDQLDVSAKIKTFLRKQVTEQLNEKGELLYGVWDRIGRDLKNLGTQTVDYDATRKVIAEAMQGKEAALKAWAEKLILPLHASPSLTLKGRKVPYTLENIVEAMTGRVRGREDTLAFGDGAARAHISKRFKDLEQMRKAAGEQIVPEAEVNAARERAQKVLAQYREQVADYTTITNYRGNKDHFAAFDAAMRALITWAKGKKDAATLARALRAEDFENVPDNVVQLGQRAAQLWLQAPVPYFEAKPQRAVGLDEFIGAVIPEGSPPEVIEILDKHGIRHRTYTGSTDAQTTEAAAFAQQLSAEGLPALFSAPRRAYQTMTFEPSFVTPFGQIVSYHWMSKPIGGMEAQRVSDWSQARTNAATGRDIVHHFKVQKPDGIHTVSLETALGQLSDTQRKRLQGLIRAEQSRRQDQATGQMALFASGRTPILSSSRDVAGLRTAKDAWTSANYDEAQAEQIVDKFYKPAAFDSIPVNAVLLPMPSTSGHNILPDLLAKRIAEQQGATIAAGQIGRATARTEAKKKTTFWAKMEDPVNYLPGKDFNSLLEAKGPIYLVEDVHNTGESWMAMRRLLEEHGITVAGVATLTATELRVTSPRDIERLSEKVASLTNTALDETTPLLHGLFHDSYKQWFNKAERSATGDARQASRLLDAARAHAAARAPEYRPQGQDAQEVSGRGSEDFVNPAYEQLTLFSAPRLEESAIQGYLDLADVNVPTAKQPAAKRAIRAAEAVTGPAYLPASGGDAAARGRLDALRERAQRTWRGLMNQDVDALKEAFTEKDSFSTLIHDFVSREIPSFDIRGAIIQGPDDFAAFNLAVRSPYFESLKIAVLDSALQVVHSQIVHVGGLNEAVVDQKVVAGILATAKMLNPKAKLIGWMIAHNHPSGDPAPSDADKRVTKRLVAMGEMLGLPLMDHVVTNGQKYFSFREFGVIGSANIDQSIDELPKRSSKPKLPILPTPKDKPVSWGYPANPDGPMADWEAVPTGSTITLHPEPSKALPYLQALRTADPDHYHVLYLDTRLALRAVERFPTSLTTAQLFQGIVLGSAREGAFSYTLGFPSATQTEQRAITVEAATGRREGAPGDWIVRIDGQFESLWSSEAEAREWAASIPATSESKINEDSAHVPTDQQRRLVRRLREQSQTIGLQFTDAMTVSADNYFSFAEHGIMEEPALYASPKLRAAADTAARAARASGIVSYDDFRALIAAKLPQALTTLDPILPEVWDLSAQPRLALDLPEAPPKAPTVPVPKSPTKSLPSLKASQSQLPFQPRAPTIERTTAPLPPGADMTPLERAEADALQREQRDLDQQFDTLEDELAAAGDEALDAYQDDPGLASSPRIDAAVAAIMEADATQQVTPILNDLTLDELKQVAKAIRYPATGSKKDLIRRLLNVVDFRASARVIRGDAIVPNAPRVERTPEQQAAFQEERRQAREAADLADANAPRRSKPARWSQEAFNRNMEAIRLPVSAEGVSQSPSLPSSPRIQTAVRIDGKTHTSGDDTHYFTVLDHLIRTLPAWQREDRTQALEAADAILTNDWLKQHQVEEGFLVEGKFLTRQQTLAHVRKLGLTTPLADTEDRDWFDTTDLTELHSAPQLASSQRTPTQTIEATGLAPAISVGGTPYTGRPGMTHGEILGDYVWRKVFTPQQRRDDPNKDNAVNFAYDTWMDSRGSGFDDFGFLDTRTAKFLTREEAYTTLKERGFTTPADGYSAKNESLDSVELFDSTPTKNEEPGTRNLPAADRIAQAAQKTNTSPSEAQIEAENYQTGKVTVHGLRLSIENPAGSVRKGTDANGKAWEVTMPHHYGRILGTTGADKDHVDFFLGPDPTSPMAFVVNQKKPGNGHFDEHKVMLGFTHPGTAARGYLDSYSKGWRGYHSIVPMTLPQLKHWLDNGKMGEAVTKAPVVSNDTAKPKPTRPATTHTFPDGYHLTGPGLHLLPASVRAYHGTPHEIDPREGFSLNRIGTGEGAQVYGWGLYFAEAMKVAEQYRKALSYPIFRIGDKEFFKREGPDAFKKWAVGQVGQEWPREVVRYFEHAVDQFYHDGTTYGYGFDTASNRAKAKVRDMLEQNKVEEYRIQEVIGAMGRITDNVIDTTPYDSEDGRWTARAVGWKPHDESHSIDAKAYNDIWSRIGWYAATFAEAPARLKAEYEAQLKVQSEEYDRLRDDKGKPSSDPAVVEASDRIRLAEAALSLLKSGKVVPQANKRRGNLYTVDLIGDPAEFLDWDAPLGQQSQSIVAMFQRRSKKPMNNTYKKAFKKIHPFFSGDERTVREVYKQFAQDIGGSEKDASMFLADMGIKGIRYTDGNSRLKIEQTSHAWEVLTNTGKLVAKESTEEAARAAMARLQTHNYVVFDDKLVRILEKNGQPIDTPALASSNKQPLPASPRQILDATSRASFNHLDRWFTGALARQAAKVTSSDPVTAATQAASAWWNQDTPGVSTLRSLKELAQRELLPETVLPREIMSAMREMQIKQSMGQQKALDVGRALSDKPKFSDLHYPPEFVENPMHREQMFSAMEQGKVDTLPPALQQVARKLREMLVEAGREAVRQGRMNPDTFEGLRTNFMPRFTKEEAQASAGDFAKRFKLGVKDILAQRSTAFHITDTSRKDKNGLPQIVSHAKGKWRFDSQQARDAYYEDLINRQTLDGELARNDMHWMNRGDARALRSITPEMLKAPATMTKEQRDVVARVQRQLRNQFKREDPYEPKDLVKDPVYAVMRYLAQMTHDNAVAEFFNVIDTNPDWTSTTELKGFKKIDDNDRFGALAGKFVRKDIALEVMELANIPHQVTQLYDTLLRLWKTGKTVLNPATHLRNIVGNLPFAQFAGNNALNPANWSYYTHAFRTLRQGGDEYRQLYETGVLGADYASTELRAALENIVPVVQDTDTDGPIKHLIALGNRAAQWGKAHSLANVATLGSVGATAGFIAAGPLGALAGAGIAAAANPIYRGALMAYRLEDDLFKAAAFFKARAMGMNKDQAAQHVRDWFPYYDKPTSMTIKVAGRSALPFVSFFRESARIGAKAVKERPISLAVSLSIPSIITALSYAALGIKDEDKEDLEEVMRGKGAKLLGVTPLAGVPIFSMRIPWRTDSGQLQQIDLSSTHPFADFLANRVENFNDDPWWKAWGRAAFSNPLASIGYAIATERDAFGDRTISDKTYSDRERLAAVLNHAYKTVVPPLAPGGSNWTMIDQSTRRQANKTLALRSPAQAVGRGVLGIDVRNADPDIYSLADAFRKRRGLPVTEGNTAYPTDAAGRARKALFEELVQPQPSSAALAKLLQTLNDLGKPVRTVSDVLDILDYRRPDGVINPKELRAPFRASLAPEARRVLDTALKEFQRARAATPGAFAKARQQIKPTTRAPITEP